jgi:hypothetical protein
VIHHPDIITATYRHAQRHPTATFTGIMPTSFVPEN